MPDRWCPGSGRPSTTAPSRTWRLPGCKPVMTFLQLAGESPICTASRRRRAVSIFAIFLFFSRTACWSLSVSWESRQTPSHRVASLLNGTGAGPQPSPPQWAGSSFCERLPPLFFRGRRRSVARCPVGCRCCPVGCRCCPGQLGRHCLVILAVRPPSNMSSTKDM